MIILGPPATPTHERRRLLAQTHTHARTEHAKNHAQADINANTKPKRTYSAHDARLRPRKTQFYFYYAVIHLGSPSIPPSQKGGGDTQLPLLRQLSRKRGILGKRQILALVFPSTKIHRVGSKNHLEGREAPTRYGSVQAPLYLCRTLFPRESIVFLQPDVNSLRRTTPTFRNPWGAQQELEKVI